MVHSALTGSIPTEQAEGPVLDWLPAESAPRDGRWILIEGEMSGGDTSTARVARWNPTIFNGLEYEWEAFNADAHGRGDDTVAPVELWNWYCDGRVFGWMPLPALANPTPTQAQGGYGAARSEAECGQEQ